MEKYKINNIIVFSILVILILLFGQFSVFVYVGFIILYLISYFMFGLDKINKTKTIIGWLLDMLKVTTWFYGASFYYFFNKSFDFVFQFCIIILPIFCALFFDWDYKDLIFIYYLEFLAAYVCFSIIFLIIQNPKEFIHRDEVNNLIAKGWTIEQIMKKNKMTRKEVEGKIYEKKYSLRMSNFFKKLFFKIKSFFKLTFIGFIALIVIPGILLTSFRGKVINLTLNEIIICISILIVLHIIPYFKLKYQNSDLMNNNEDFMGLGFIKYMLWISAVLLSLSANWYMSDLLTSFYLNVVINALIVITILFGEVFANLIKEGVHKKDQRDKWFKEFYTFYKR